VPAPQGVQFVASVASLNVPAAQLSQAVTFAWGSVTFLVPAVQEEPAPAETHLSEPGPDTSLSPQGRQSSMDELPKFEFLVLAGQGVCREELEGQ
jgi:hypothetical protein